MNDWVRRNLKRGLEWSDGITRIKVSHDLSGLDVTIYPGGQRTISVRLLTSFGFDHIHICDLPSAAVGTPWHNKKYGTLAVCLLIDGYKQLFPTNEHAKIRVHGKTHCTLNSDEESVVSDCERRSAFWERFGLKVLERRKITSPMSCTLEELHSVDREIYPGLRTSLSLFNFWLPIHAPEFFEKDLAKLAEVQIHEHEIERIVEVAEKIDEDAVSSYRELRVCVGIVVLILIVLVWSVGLRSYSIWEQVTLVITGGLLGFILADRCAPTKWSAYMPSVFFNKKDAPELKRNIKHLGKKLKSIIDGDQTFLSRIYDTLNSRLLESKLEKYQHLVCAAQTNSLDRGHNVKLGALILDLKAAIVELANQKMKEETLVDDFLFGKTGSMSVKFVTQSCRRMEHQFSHHINRFLQKTESNTISIFGSPNDRITDILESLADEIVQMEFYAIADSDATNRFGLRVIIKQGVLDFSGVWCTWKHRYLENALNAFHDMFRIHARSGKADQKPLASKAHIRWDRELEQVNQTFEEFAFEIADISGKRFTDNDVVEVVNKVLAGNVTSNA